MFRNSMNRTRTLQNGFPLHHSTAQDQKGQTGLVSSSSGLACFSDFFARFTICRSVCLSVCLSHCVCCWPDLVFVTVGPISLQVPVCAVCCLLFDFGRIFHQQNNSSCPFFLRPPVRVMCFLSIFNTRVIRSRTPRVHFPEKPEKLIPCVLHLDRF